MTRSDRLRRIPLELDLPILRDFEGEPGTSELGYCLVTGGAGYLGRHIAFELLRRGHAVRIFDRQKGDFSHDRLDFVSGDIRKYEDVRKACEGIETVFHTAAVMNFLGFATASGSNSFIGMGRFSSTCPMYIAAPLRGGFTIPRFRT